eukprot:Hpha_TRINITY_DN16210_c0_g4::TRINITY_DN16210_c0_g4_i1::g.14016::m.14016
MESTSPTAAAKLSETPQMAATTGGLDALPITSCESFSTNERDMTALTRTMQSVPPLAIHTGSRCARIGRLAPQAISLNNTLTSEAGRWATATPRSGKRSASSLGSRTMEPKIKNVKQHRQEVIRISTVHTDTLSALLLLACGCVPAAPIAGDKGLCGVLLCYTVQGAPRPPVYLLGGASAACGALAAGCCVAGLALCSLRAVLAVRTKKLRSQSAIVAVFFTAAAALAAAAAALASGGVPLPGAFLMAFPLVGLYLSVRTSNRPEEVVAHNVPLTPLHSPEHSGREHSLPRSPMSESARPTARASAISLAALQSGEGEKWMLRNSDRDSYRGSDSPQQQHGLHASPATISDQPLCEEFGAAAKERRASDLHPPGSPVTQPTLGTASPPAALAARFKQLSESAGRLSPTEFNAVTGTVRDAAAAAQGLPSNLRTAHAGSVLGAAESATSDKPDINRPIVETVHTVYEDADDDDGLCRRCRRTRRINDNVGHHASLVATAAREQAGSPADIPTVLSLVESPSAQMAYSGGMARLSLESRGSRVDAPVMLKVSPTSPISTQPQRRTSSRRVPPGLAIKTGSPLKFEDDGDSQPTPLGPLQSPGRRKSMPRTVSIGSSVGSFDRGMWNAPQRRSSDGLYLQAQSSEPEIMTVQSLRLGASPQLPRRRSSDGLYLQKNLSDREMAVQGLRLPPPTFENRTPSNLSNLTEGAPEEKEAKPVAKEDSKLSKGTDGSAGSVRKTGRLKGAVQATQATIKMRRAVHFSKSDSQPDALLLQQDLSQPLNPSPRSPRSRTRPGSRQDGGARVTTSRRDSTDVPRDNKRKESLLTVTNQLSQELSEGSSDESVTTQRAVPMQPQYSGQSLGLDMSPVTSSVTPVKLAQLRGHHSSVSFASTALPRNASLYTVRTMADDDDASVTMGERPSSHVRETNRILKSTTADGVKLINGFEVVRLLGRGASSKVKLAKDTRPPFDLRALKIVKQGMMKTVGRLGGSGAALTSGLAKVHQEVSILKKIRHKNLIALHEVMEDRAADKIILVLDFAALGPAGEVNQYTGCLEDGKVWTEKALRTLLKDVGSGMRYLHHRRILHRDIKPENILVDENGRGKISDFGSAMVLRQTGTHVRDMVSQTDGTPAYFPPESMRGGTFGGFAADVWAFGVTAFVLGVGRLPFHSTDRRALRDLITSHDPFEDLEVDIAHGYRELLTVTLIKDPRLRPTLKEIVGMVFISKAPVSPHTHGHLQWIEEDFDTRFDHLEGTSGNSPTSPPGPAFPADHSSPGNSPHFQPFPSPVPNNLSATSKVPMSSRGPRGSSPREM